MAANLLHVVADVVLVDQFDECGSNSVQQGDGKGVGVLKRSPVNFLIGSVTSRVDPVRCAGERPDWIVLVARVAFMNGGWCCLPSQKALLRAQSALIYRWFAADFARGFGPHDFHSLYFSGRHFAHGR